MTTEGWITNKSNSGSSASESPKNKIKFLCSQGGKILPRPVDGHLKYVGGETRIISVPRDIKFQELMKKLTYQIEGEMVLKYQLVPEDLHALVTVRSDEDLSHMFDEYDRSENTGAPKLRTFLFPTKPENHTEIHTLEQRYVAAINGCTRAHSTSAGTKQQRPVLNICRSSFAMSPPEFSASPSPRSPENSYADITAHEQIPNNYQSHRGHMYRVQSSPSISNINGYLQSNQSFQQQSYNNCYINLHQRHHSKPPVNGPERIITIRSVGRSEGLRFQVDPTQNHRYSCIKHPRGNGSCSTCTHFDDYGSWSDKRPEKNGCSLPPSPLSTSPRAQQNHISFMGSCDIRVKSLMN